MRNGPGIDVEGLQDNDTLEGKVPILLNAYGGAKEPFWEGGSAFPPLAGDPVVTDEDPTRHIEAILFGMEGEAIDGVEYSAAMPPFAEQLSDKEVAAIVNHERTSWGSDAPTVSDEDVEKVRNKGN